MKLNKRICFLVSAAIAAVTTSPFSSAADVRINTPRGSALEMIVELPTGSGPFPALVLAPGQGYHARLPLLERTSKELTARGIAVIRFNWAYFVKDGNKGKPTDDLTAEIEDMKAVVTETKRMPRVDPSRIAVGGKSLGSLVTWRVFRDDASLRSATLLTPVCVDMNADTGRDGTLANHPEIAANTRPLLLLAGDTDAICPVRFLYGAAASIKAGTRVVITGGDHGFATKIGKNAEQESEANMALAVRATADFVAASLK